MTLFRVYDNNNNHVADVTAETHQDAVLAAVEFVKYIEEAFTPDSNYRTNKDANDDRHYFVHTLAGSMREYRVAEAEHDGPPANAEGEASAENANATEWAVTLIAEEVITSPNVAQFGKDSDGAERHAATLVKMLTMSPEPRPSVADHGPNWSTYTMSGEHDTFGSWRVVISASEGAEQCGECGDWWSDSDAWNAHNDIAHY